MPTSGFPLPSSSYKELIKIVQGYGRIGTDASLADVAKLTAIPETGVSGNNRFLVAIGVIQGGKRKAITPLGKELANALQHEIAEEMAGKWRAIIDGTDFLQKVVGAVRIRKGMDESSLESHIAYSAGQPKTPAVATGARAVVEILLAAGLLKEDGGSLIAATQDLPTIPETVQQSFSISERTQPVNLFNFKHQSDSVATANLGGVQLTIEVTVQCSPHDLETLGSKLRKVIQDFNKPEPPTPNDDARG
jgi:hypothetical protein